ncbi:MAG: hypothetical protein ACK4F6_06905 [Hylemonella sp.]
MTSHALGLAPNIVGQVLAGEQHFYQFTGLSEGARALGRRGHGCLSMTMGGRLASAGASADVAGTNVEEEAPQRMQLVYRFIVSPAVQAAAWSSDLRASNSVISAWTQPHWHFHKGL